MPRSELTRLTAVHQPAQEIAPSAADWFDIRTTGLWWGGRYELRDSTLFDYATGRTYSMALVDGTTLDHVTIAQALRHAGGLPAAIAFLAYAIERPAVLRSPEQGRRAAARAALAGWATPPPHRTHVDTPDPPQRPQRRLDGGKSRA